jgi:NAD(P)H-dependent nitrite reductase small subunit
MMANFVKVAEFGDLPDDTGMVVEAGGQEIALFKVGVEVYALENECPHREGPIGEGELEDDVVTCPWHAWQVNVRTGEVVYDPRLCAKTFRCRVEDGAVYVEIEGVGSRV